MGTKKTSYIYDSDDMDSGEDYPQYRPAPLHQKQSTVPPLQPELQRPPAAILPTRSHIPRSLSTEPQQKFNFQNISSKQDELFVQTHDFTENLHHVPDSTFSSHHHSQLAKRQQSQSENNIEGCQYVDSKTAPHNLNLAHYSSQRPLSAPKDPWLETFHTYRDEQSRYKQGVLSAPRQYQSNQRSRAPNSFISQENVTSRSRKISLAKSDRVLEEYEEALASSYKLEGNTAAVDVGALMFTDSDIPEIIERIKDCFYGGIFVRLSELGDYFRAIHGFSLSLLMKQVRFQKEAAGKPEKLAQWIENLDYDLFVPRSLRMDSSCVWIQRYDQETKLIIEDLLAEEAHLMRTRDRSILLSECLIDQLVSLFGINLPFIQIPWTFLLELYHFGYKRAFPVDLLLANYFGHRGKQEMEGDRLLKVIAEVLQDIHNRRLVPCLRKQNTELWIHINPQVALQSNSLLKRVPMNVEEPTLTTTSLLPSPFSFEQDEDYEDGDSIPRQKEESVLDYYEPTTSELVIACRLFQCFQGGFLMRFSEVPTNYTKLFQCVLNFKIYVRDGYTYKKFLDWIKSLPYFSMPEYPSELRVLWMRRKDKGASQWIMHFQKLFKDTQAHISEITKGQLSIETTKGELAEAVKKKKVYLEALLKRQVRSLFGVVTRIRITSLYAMLLDIFGPNFQVPLHPIFNAINFEMALLTDASPSDVMTHLLRTWNEGTVRYICMGLEEFVQIDPLPLTERATCMCQNCAGQSKSSIQGVTQIVSLEARLGLDVEEETTLPKTPLNLGLRNDKDIFRIEEFSKLSQLSDDLFQPRIPSYIAQASTFMTAKGEMKQKRCISLESLFADDLYGLDFSSQQLGTKTKKLNLQIQPEMERDEDIDSDTTWNSKFLNFFITPEVLPYFSVTEHAPDDYYGDFKVY